MPRIIVTIVLGIFAAAGAVRADPEVPADRLLPHNLVDMVVAAAARLDGRYTATFRVTHVFKGDPGLRNKTMEFNSSVLGESWHGSPWLPWPLKQGEKSIWLVKEDAGSVTWVAFGPRIRRTYIPIVRLPVREGEPGTPERPPYDPPYADVLAWAKTVEETVKAKPPERFAMLRKHAESFNTLIACWALAVLADVDPDGSRPLFQQLLKRKDLPQLTRMRIEQMFFFLDWSLRGRRK